MQSTEMIVIVQPITHNGLCHLLAKLSDCCLSSQLARLVALDLSNHLKLSTENGRRRREGETNKEVEHFGQRQS